MKKINFIIKFSTALIICSLFCPSCNVLDQDYPMGYDDDKVFTKSENVYLAAVGMYDAMQNSEFLGGRAQIYADIRSEDTNPASYFGNVATFDPTSSNTIVRDAWTGAYRTVAKTNLFLESMAKYSGIIPENDEKRLIAEAKFLRATVYFYILNFWGDQYTEKGTGLGVPVVLRTFDAASAFSDEAKIPRSTTDDVYARIIKDLEEAIPALSQKTKPSFESSARATKGAAYALLSRVYLYKEEYDKVITNANLVTGYSLEPNLKDGVFTAPPTASDEIIFFIAMNAADNPNTNNSIGQHYGAGKRADITVSLKYIDNFDDPDDRRLTQLIEKTGTAPNFIYWCNKYRADGNADWSPVLRYAEVLLNKAEASAKNAASGIDATALSIVNEIRTRSGAAIKNASDFADKTEFVNYILAERRRELAFEGHGSFDLFRNKKGIAAGRGGASVAAVPFPNDKFALPIPDADVSKAPGILIQNPSY